MAPAIKSIFNIWLKRAVNILKMILPEKTRLTKPKNGVGTINPGINTKRDNDPFVNAERHCLSSIHFLLNHMEKCPETYKKYKCPFLTIQGGIDKLVHPMGAFDLFNQSPLDEKDKDIIFVEEMWHDLWHEPQVFDITSEIGNWMIKRIQSNPEEMSQKDPNERIEI